MLQRKATNKRLWFCSAGQVELRDDPLPGPPEPLCVQVEVRCAGLCRFDVALFDGVMPAVLPRPAGHEAVGVVRHIGAGVAGLELGDWVSLIGEALEEPYFAQRVNVPARLAARLSEPPRRPELWLAEPVVCVVNSLHLSPPRTGARVAVVGAGFMGLLFLQGLRGQPVAQTVAIDLLESRLELAHRFGALPVQLHEPANIAGLAKELGTYQMVIETAGTQASLDLACELAAPAGELVLFAWHKADAGSRTINASAWHQKGLRISNNAPISNPHYHELHRPTIDLMARGLYDLEPLMTHVRPFDAAQELFQTASAGADGYVKGALYWT